MALPVSPPLSMTQIATEFGGSLPHSMSEYYGVAAGVPASGTLSFTDFLGKSAVIPGQQLFTTSGSFVVPAGVTLIKAVAIGGGGGGAEGAAGDSYAMASGGGGALSYDNAISVTPGETLTITRGSGGSGASNMSNGGNGGASFIQRGAVMLLRAEGGEGGRWSTEQGGAGGSEGTGVGAVRYSGADGRDAGGTSNMGGNTAGYTANGGAASGSGTGVFGTTPGGGTLYGAGGRSYISGGLSIGQSGTGGAVRIMWGDTRSFPDNAGDV